MTALVLLACTDVPDTVTLRGVVRDAPGTDATPVVAEVRTFGEDLLPVDTTTSASDGTFDIRIPTMSTFHVHLGGDGWATTVFSGTSAVTDVDAGAGVPWVATPAWIDGTRTAHGACARSADAGGIVAGEVRTWLPSTPLLELPLTDDAQVAVLDRDAVRHEACYLDDTGASDPDATMTGATGRFAVFGIPAGPLVVGVSWPTPGGERTAAEFLYLMAEDGVVCMLPALTGAP
jgi:hypothetical protein